MIDQAKLSTEIQEYADSVVLPSKKATELFRFALVDTITHTVTIREDDKVFVATGDIPAMWLRDSTFQVLPYLSIAKEVPGVKQLIHGVIRQQFEYIKHDPYANAFNKEMDGGHYSQDKSNIPISDLVWERKFEIDSLCAPLFLSYKLYKKTGYTNHLTTRFWEIVEGITDIFIKEQNHMTSDYRFERNNCPPSDTLSNGGQGAPIGYTGMVWSGFRPSDDACQYGYLIPGNMFIVVVLKQMLELMPNVSSYSSLQLKMNKLLMEVEQGIRQYGTLKSDEGSQYYAYEVDGLGNTLFMDDANIPSLLSLPFLGYCDSEDSIYLETRDKCLSFENPYYYAGTYLKGIGSPHTPPNYVWPISLAMEGITSDSVREMEKIIEAIVTTDAGTMQCHEGVDVENPANYTREWFSWANMTYCSLVFHYLQIKGLKS